MRRWVETWRARAGRLTGMLQALWIASRDRRTPWYARVVAGIVLAYASSPIDLIPDPIPVLGYLDDLILLPLGVALVIRLIPYTVWYDARARAAAAPWSGKRSSRAGVAAVVALWSATMIGAVCLVRTWWG